LLSLIISSNFYSFNLFCQMFHEKMATLIVIKYALVLVNAPEHLMDAFIVIKANVLARVSLSHIL